MPQLYYHRGTINGTAISNNRTILIFPGNTGHNAQDVAPFTPKSGNGLAQAAAELGQRGIPTLSLPTTGMPLTPKEQDVNMARNAIADLYRAVGAGFDLVLPVRSYNPDSGFFSAPLADSPNSYGMGTIEPGFWGGEEKTPNRGLANYYVASLNDLQNFLRALNEAPNMEIDNKNPLMQAFLEGQAIARSLTQNETLTDTLTPAQITKVQQGWRNPAELEYNAGQENYDETQMQQDNVQGTANDSHSQFIPVPPVVPPVVYRKPSQPAPFPRTQNLETHASNEATVAAQNSQISLELVTPPEAQQKPVPTQQAAKHPQGKTAAKTETTQQQAPSKVTTHAPLDTIKKTIQNAYPKATGLISEDKTALIIKCNPGSADIHVSLPTTHTPTKLTQGDPIDVAEMATVAAAVSGQPKPCFEIGYSPLEPKADVIQHVTNMIKALEKKGCTYQLSNELKNIPELKNAIDPPVQRAKPR